LSPASCIAQTLAAAAATLGRGAKSCQCRSRRRRRGGASISRVFPIFARRRRM